MEHKEADKRHDREIERETHTQERTIFMQPIENARFSFRFVHKYSDLLSINSLSAI